MCWFPSLFLTFLLFSTLAFLILTLFLLLLSSLCRDDEGRKKKGKQSCWQRSASPARGPRCLGLVHHGRRSHLQIRRETLKECKWERKGERLRARERKGEEATLTMHAQTHRLVLRHRAVWIDRQRISQRATLLQQLEQVKQPSS